MKALFTVLILLLTYFITFSQTEVTIGMTIDEFEIIYPNLEKHTYEDEITYVRPVDIYGLEDEWGYRFGSDTLAWIFFMKYVDDIDAKNFKKCLSATRHIIDDFTKLYGTPDTTIIGDTTFVDPYEQRHWGYDVLQARWSNYKNMKIKAEFTFMGGKGEYHFIFKVNYFDKSYPYYD